MAKDETYVRLIHTQRWNRLRRIKLSDDPLCEQCLKVNRIELAVEVHHVTPVEDARTEREKERLMFDYHNLMALCHNCHVEKHKEMGRSGKAYALRRARQQLEDFKKRFMG
jgi:5-methylcytosine-specific restriction protein A